MPGIRCYSNLTLSTMRKRIVFALFALMVVGFSLTGCKSQELCPAYGDSTTEQTQEILS